MNKYLNHDSIKKTLGLLIVGCFCIVLVGVLQLITPHNIFDADAKDIASKSLKHEYPRLAVVDLGTPDINKIDEYAKFQVGVFNIVLEEAYPQFLELLRAANPDMIILSYINVAEFPKYRVSQIEPAGTGVWHNIQENLEDEWYLQNSSGEEVSIWPGYVLLNLTKENDKGQTYAEYLSDYLASDVLQSPYWDGMFFDVVFKDISWASKDIDINGDGRKDPAYLVNQKWYEGQDVLFSSLREKVGEDKVILVNSVGNIFTDRINGRQFEGFPKFEEGSWAGSLQKYLTINDQSAYEPHVTIINSDTGNTGNWQDYRAMRFGLTSTLLSDGYYNFDYGTFDRSQVYWYDEYSVYLGDVLNDPQDISAATDSGIAEGVWQREFSNGLSLVNSTYDEQTIQLRGDFERIHGEQDPIVNSGLITDTVTLQGRDGIILLRPLGAIYNSVHTNGSFVRVFDEYGNNVRTGFYAYDNTYSSDEKVLRKDIDGDGVVEIISSDKNQIVIRDDGEVITRFYPYTSAYSGGVNFVVDDLNGDGTLEIVTGTLNGGGPQIRIFAMDGRLIHGGFFAYSKHFRGGVNVAVGDLNGDGFKEIIAGAGVGGGPHVRVFDKDGRVINPGFFAYDHTFRGGVRVAVGDLNNDGIDDIVTGPGTGGSPEVRVYDKDGNRTFRDFFAFDAGSQAGVEVGLADIDADGDVEIITTTQDVFTLVGN